MAWITCLAVAKFDTGVGHKIDHVYPHDMVSLSRGFLMCSGSGNAYMQSHPLQRRLPLPLQRHCPVKRASRSRSEHMAYIYCLMARTTRSIPCSLTTTSA